MKNNKKLLVAFVVIIAVVCTVVLAACGGDNWPESYKFTGTLRMTTQQGESTADTELVLNDDATLSLSVINNGTVMAKWSGSWKQNKDGTVEITFKQADAEDGVGSMMGLTFSLNTADKEAGGMGGLTITTEIDDNNVNTFTILILLNLGEAGEGYVMPLEIPMTQVVEEAAE